MVYSYTKELFRKVPNSNPMKIQVLRQVLKSLFLQM